MTGPDEDQELSGRAQTSWTNHEQIGVPAMDLIAQLEAEQIAVIHLLKNNK